MLLEALVVINNYCLLFFLYCFYGESNGSLVPIDWYKNGIEPEWYEEVLSSLEKKLLFLAFLEFLFSKCLFKLLLWLNSEEEVASSNRVC